MKTYGYDTFFGLRLLSFCCFLYFFHLFFSSPPPFLCRLEFISNQRASRELQLLITYSFAFLHINDCRVLVGFLPQWFKGTSVLCSPGRRRDGQRQGSKPVQFPPLSFLIGAGQSKKGGGGVVAGGIWDGWVALGGGDYRVHRVKVNVPYQHKKEHMSSALPNYCHIEQFKHLI